LAQTERRFEANLAPGGRVLLSDRFRSTSLRLLEAMEGDGWRIGFSKWDLGEDATLRPVGVFQLLPSGSSADPS
jgi:hypothetical protein